MDPEEGYKAFRSGVAQQKKAVGMKKQYIWEYFDSGVRNEANEAPIVMLPGAGGSSDCFYKQVLGLSAKGHRVISVKFPAIYSYQDFVSSFERFLDALELSKIHLFGAALGGFLAQVYAQERPERLESLILCNTFCDSSYFAEQSACLPFFGYMPEFYLKKIILDNFPKGPFDSEQERAVDFMVRQVEKLSQQDVAARLTLNTIPLSIDLPKISSSLVTVIHTFDTCSTPAFMLEQLAARYPGCRLAQLKTGGDFPYLATPAEFNMMIEVHLLNIQRQSEQSSSTVREDPVNGSL
eukprot:c9365_g1_i1.p1 GENE.c9365_g1_i1~~c9365_g1_i1.p1  ORF type:complete len:295 (-),score=63.22 c9365_g1_i1:175-1059(-)